MTCDIKSESIEELLEHFSKISYSSGHHGRGFAFNNKVLNRCHALFQANYKIHEMNNVNGNISTYYPQLILAPEFEKPTNNVQLTNSSAATSNGSSQSRAQGKIIYEHSYDMDAIEEAMISARSARCRARVPVPVIMYKNKYICRSSTLACGMEMSCTVLAEKAGIETNSATKPEKGSVDLEIIQEKITNSFDDDGNKENSQENNKENDQANMHDVSRGKDIALLKKLNVGTIIDLMVEMKKQKLGFKITSSEKADKENRYAEFNTISLPYPGCEFFREFRDNSYSHENIKFDWSQSTVDAVLNVPIDAHTAQLTTDWEQYRQWDIVQMTQNYLKLCLKYIQESNSGILIHCISGWDRTPLFISLLRMSLWADGVLHQSLTLYQMLYLTLAYDWYMFGHNLQDRLSKKEDILYFCFYALKFIESEEFSVVTQRPRSKHNSNSSSSGSSSSTTTLPSTDSESTWDGLSFDDDVDNISETIKRNLSNLSINSDGSGDGAKDSFNGTTVSPQFKRPITSPVSVPMSRQRNESISSAGSWQMITQSGSIPQEPIYLQQIRNSNNSNGDDSSATFIYARRRERLLGLRTTFSRAYGKSIGMRYHNGHESLFATLGWFAETVAQKIGKPT